MARYYRRRYTRVVKPKKKWASNIRDIDEVANNQSSPTYVSVTPLVANSTQVGVPTPTIVKTGNFKVQLDTSYVTSAGTVVQVRTFVMYLPEGSVITTYAQALDVISKHPEWIMAWKYGSIDYTLANATGGTQTLNFSSRLKRNLNSGDEVKLITILSTASTTTNLTSIQVGGMVQFWTCAN